MCCISLTLRISAARNRLALAVEQLATKREKVVLQNGQITEFEQEIWLLRKQLERLETEKDKDQKLIAELREAVTRAREVRTNSRV